MIFFTQMKTAYFDCSSGISGDMTLGALIDLGVPVPLLNQAVRSVVETVQIDAEQVRRKGFRATLAKVHTPHEHTHRHLSDILALIDKGKLTDLAKKHASDIFRLLAEAEAFVHGTDIEKVHFHEVGAADSIADIVGAAVGFDYLKIDEYRASAVPTGCGTIQIAHGTCSVPAPATAELLQGIPLAASEVPFELTTPTGAALLKHYVHRFGSLPEITVQNIGVGAGGRDLEEQANILRILVGYTDLDSKHLHAAMKMTDSVQEHRIAAAPQHGHRHETPVPIEREKTVFPVSAELPETAWMLETNLDDISGELIGHCVEQLWTLSPLDVWTTPIQMKKQRPGVTLSVLCRREQVEPIESLLFSETSTLGVRRWQVERTVLRRENSQLTTPWGLLDIKRAVLPNGKEKTSPEFESAKRIAAEKGIPVREVYHYAAGTMELF